jgi:hypothetical protein
MATITTTDKSHRVKLCSLGSPLVVVRVAPLASGTWNDAANAVAAVRRAIHQEDECRSIRTPILNGHNVCPTAQPVQTQPALHTKENVMGKYFLGWLLGVPTIVLVVLWFFFH